jgi:hypothetical protein
MSRQPAPVAAAAEAPSTGSRFTARTAWVRKLETLELGPGRPGIPWHPGVPDLCPLLAYGRAMSSGGA